MCWRMCWYGSTLRTHCKGRDASRLISIWNIVLWVTRPAHCIVYPRPKPSWTLDAFHWIVAVGIFPITYSSSRAIKWWKSWLSVPWQCCWPWCWFRCWQSRRRRSWPGSWSGSWCRSWSFGFEGASSRPPPI